MSATLTLLLLMGGGGLASWGSDDMVEPPEPASDQVIRDVFESEHGTRPYRLYLPSKATDREGAGIPLLVVLHGCTQDAEDVARGTRMDEHGRERGMAVLYPEQTPDAHATRCWNWYEPDHQSAGGGEPALLAEMIQEVTEAWGLDPRRVYVAGISAGGAMAVVLAATHPELIRGVASHSGVAYRAAVGLDEAAQVLAGGRAEPTRDLAKAAVAAMGDEVRRIPLLVIHGAEDSVVAPRNARWLTEQWAGLAETLTGREVQRDENPTRPRPEGDARVEVVRGGDGRLWVEFWTVEALGHAWSGGSGEGTFTWPGGLDASRLMVEFFLDEGGQ